MLAVQTPDGVKLIPESALNELELDELQRMSEGLAPALRADQHLPDKPFRPAGMAQGDVGETSGPPTPLQVGARVDTMKRATGAGLSLKQQKSARQAIRVLAQSLAKAPEDDWVGVVGAAIVETPEMLDYLNAVTLYASLAEAKVDAALADLIVTALRESELIPEGMLVYDEADLKAASEKPPEPAPAPTPEPEPAPEPEKEGT